MNIKKTINIFTFFVFIFLSIYSFLNINANFSICISLILISIYINGKIAKLIHMSFFKMRYILLGDKYDTIFWLEEKYTFNYCIPIIMEFSYQKNLPPFICGAIEDYTDLNENEKAKPYIPKIFKVANFMLDMNLLMVVNIFVLSLFVFIFFSNIFNNNFDFIKIELCTYIISIVALLEICILIMYNLAMCRLSNKALVEYFPINKFSISDILTSISLLFSSYSLIIFTVYLTIKVLNFDLPFSNNLIVLNILNYHLVIVAILAIIQTHITKSKLDTYQNYLDSYLDFNINE